MPTQRTWADIVEYVSEFDKREGAVPNRTLYRLLGDKALAVIAERCGVYETYWQNNGGGTDIVLTNASCPLPIDLCMLKRVEYNGSDNPLERAELAWLDEFEAGWREATGDPDKFVVVGNTLILNAIPSSTTGKLVLRGTAYLPSFSDTSGATNPLTYLPWNAQMLPAEYIIAHLPVTPATPIEYDEGGVRFALEETRRRERVRAEALQRFELGLEELAAVKHRQQYETFRY